MKHKPIPAGFITASLLLVLFVALPLLVTLFSSTPGELGQTLRDPEVAHSIGLTFGAAGIATAFGLLGGVPLAYLLARYRFTGKRVLQALVDLPIVIPHTAAGVALLMVFGRQGVLGKPLAGMGMFFTDSLGGIVVAMMFVSLPFLVNASRDAITLVDAEMEHVALIDGASAWQAFWLVTLPQAWRGVAGGALMMWARGISEFGAVVILAYHPKIVPVLVYERFEGFGLKTALPVAVLLIIAAVIVFGLLRWLLTPERD